MEGLITSYRKFNETQAGIWGTLKLILERLNTIERRSTLADLNCDEIGCCARSIDCECAICIVSDTTCPDTVGYCARSIDCECDICIGGDTSTGSEGLNYDETEINRPSDFHILNDSQLELDSLVLGCTRELELSSEWFITLLECVKIKTARVASYLFDKMSERGHVQASHVFMVIKSKFSFVLVEKGLVVTIWDPGVSLKTLKLVGHTNTIRGILMDMTSLFCLQGSPDNINRVRDFSATLIFLHQIVIELNRKVPTKATLGVADYGHSGHIARMFDENLQRVESCFLDQVANMESYLVQFDGYECVKSGCLDNVRGVFVSTGQGTKCSRQCERKPHFLILEFLSASCLEAVLPLDDDLELLQPWVGGMCLSILQDTLMSEMDLDVIVFTAISPGLLHLGSLWKDGFAMSLITSRVEVIGLHILLSNTNGSASLRDEAATVRTMVYGLYFTFDPGGILIGQESKAVGLQFQKMQVSIILLQHTCIFTGHVTSFFPIPSWSPAYGSKFSSNVIHIEFLLVEKRAWKCVFSKFPANVKRLPCVDIELRHDACWEEALKAVCYNLPMNFVERLLVEISMLRNGKNRLFDDASGVKITEFIVSWEDIAKHVLISRKEIIALKFDVVPMAICYIWPMVLELHEVSCGLLWGLSALSFAAMTPPLDLVSWRTSIAFITLRQNQRNEKLQVTGILMTFVPEDWLTVEGYNSLIGTISTILQLEKSSRLTYMNVDYSKLTNGYKEVMCLVGLMEAVEDIEVVECLLGLVPSFHQIGGSTDNLKNNTAMMFNLIGATCKAHRLSHQFPFDPGGSSIKRFNY